MSQRYCCGVSTFTSDSERGHWYAPCSSRLYSRMKPSFSQYKSLDTVSPPPAEQGQCVGKWIQLKLLLDEARQAVYAFAQIW